MRNKKINFLSQVIKANQKIYKILQKGMKKSYFKKFEVGAGGDVSSKIDLIAEEIFIKYLASFGRINSEESGIIGEGKDEIIIDPIDGSTNCLSLFPYFGSSVALRQDGKITVGVIANFANGDIFIKDKNQFKVAKLHNLKFKDVKKTKNDKIVGIFEKGYKENHQGDLLRKNDIKYRVPGAIALSLAYGHYVDFLLFANLSRDYDIMAGLYMCEDLHISTINGYTLICKDKKRHKFLKEVLKG